MISAEKTIFLYSNHTWDVLLLEMDMLFSKPDYVEFKTGVDVNGTVYTG